MSKETAGSEGRARVALATGLVLLAGLGTVAVADDAAATVAVPASQELAVLLHDVQARAAPAAGAAPVALVRAQRPITHGPTVLPVVGHRTGPGGAAWLRVRLAGRPNGRTAWIRQSATTGVETAWHVVVGTASRRVTVYRLGRVVRVFAAVVGKPSTPTPQGSFFVEEAVLLPAGAAGAPLALALSARSWVLQEFDGGPGQIALHGTANLTGVPGSAASHGCVRLETAAIRWLAEHVGAGTPVSVRAA